MLGFNSRFVVVPARSVNGESVLLPNAYFISGERPFKRKWQYGSTNGFLEYEAQRPTKYSRERMVSSEL